MKHIIITFLSLLSISMTANGENTLIDSLWNDFSNPPVSSRTKLWWFHGETESTKDGIEADLKAFKEKGIGGVVYYDQVHGKGKGAAPSMSPEWWNMLKHSAITAKELGLSFEVAVGNGYVTGGPWITPELAMKKTVYADTFLIVDKTSRQIIDLSYPSPHFRDIATLLFPDSRNLLPVTVLNEQVKILSNDTVIPVNITNKETFCGISYTLTPRGKGSTGSMNIPGKPQERYFGAKYIDYPPIGQLEYSTDSIIWNKAVDLLPIENNIGHKSRRRTISFPSAEGRYFRLLIHDWKGADDNYKSISIGDLKLYRRDIIDNLETQTGLRTEVTYPVPRGGNNGAVSIADIINITDSVTPDGTIKCTIPKGEWRVLRIGYVPTGARTKHGRKNLLGYEADVMSAEAADIHYSNYFKPILDTLTAVGARPSGMCMDSHEAGTQNWTDGFEKRFLQQNGYDLIPWLPTLAGYIVENREKSDKTLLDFRTSIASAITSEYYGTFAARCAKDSVDYTTQAMLNIETDNIANRGKAVKPQGEFWAYQSDGNFDCLDAASAAHLYGHNIASGEAFTDTPYNVSWDSLLRIANIAYCRGINEFAVCASTHQPWSDRKYDDSNSAHPYVFHRFHPGWNKSAEFWNYQARCATLLRKGNPVVDICVYLGEDPPLKTMAYKLPLIPEGYNFDVCTYPALIDRMKAKDGQISVDGGMTYKTIIVPDRTYISPAAEQKLAELALNGATVIRCDKGETVACRLKDVGLQPDIEFHSKDLPDDKLLFFHRTLDGADIYFIYNHSPQEFIQNVKLRSRHTDIQSWNPRTADRTYHRPHKAKAVKREERSGQDYPLHLAPYQSLFIIASSNPN